MKPSDDNRGLRFTDGVLVDGAGNILPDEAPVSAAEIERLAGIPESATCWFNHGSFVAAQYVIEELNRKAAVLVTTEDQRQGYLESVYQRALLEAYEVGARDVEEWAMAQRRRAESQL